MAESPSPPRAPPRLGHRRRDKWARGRGPRASRPRSQGLRAASPRQATADPGHAGGLRHARLRNPSHRGGREETGRTQNADPFPPRSPNESCCKTLALKPFPCFRFVRTILAQSCLKTILQLQESRSFKAPAARGPLPVGCINSIYLNNQSPEPRDRDPLFLLSGSAVLPRTVNADGKSPGRLAGPTVDSACGWGWGGV